MFTLSGPDLPAQLVAAYIPEEGVLSPADIDFNAGVFPHPAGQVEECEEVGVVVFCYFVVIIILLHFWVIIIFIG